MIRLRVTGMTCDGCSRAIARAIAKCDPSAQVVADVATGMVDAETALTAPELAKAIEAAGYAVVAG